MVGGGGMCVCVLGGVKLSSKTVFYKDCSHLGSNT